MVFSSNIFLFFFLPSVLILYYLFPGKCRNAVLLLASLLFYAWGEPSFLILMISVILLNYGAAAIMERYRERAKTVMVITVCLNLLILGVFKYAGFLARSANLLLPGQAAVPIPEIVLPIGISFYIFQSMSYVVDVYRGTVRSQKNLLRFAAYVSMFPQLIAGPIVRYRDIADQLGYRKESTAQFADGVEVFLIGLAKKLLIANHMGALWEALKATEGSLSALMCMFAYTLQIYFDFSGYSDMAIGLGRMFGFEFLPNFDYPYISKSITEFWRRWHISLGSWFREYVYIPLGGNRKGNGRQILNILIVWGLTGLWHGASWNFVFWGLYYGLLLILEKLLLRRWMERLPACLRILIVWMLVSFGWVLFSFTDFGELTRFLGRLFAARGCSVHETNLMLAYLPLMTAALVGATPLPRRQLERLKKGRGGSLFRIVGMGILMILCTAALASQSYNPFIYFRF